MPEWRNGRRAGLKIPCPQGHEGSTPSSGTITYESARNPGRPMGLHRGNIEWAFERQRLDTSLSHSRTRGPRSPEISRFTPLAPTSRLSRSRFEAPAANDSPPGSLAGTDRLLPPMARRVDSSPQRREWKSLGSRRPPVDLALHSPLRRAPPASRPRHSPPAKRPQGVEQGAASGNQPLIFPCWPTAGIPALALPSYLTALEHPRLVQEISGFDPERVAEPVDTQVCASRGCCGFESLSARQSSITCDGR